MKVGNTRAEADEPDVESNGREVGLEGAAFSGEEGENDQAALSSEEGKSDHVARGMDSENSDDEIQRRQDSSPPDVKSTHARFADQEVEPEDSALVDAPEDSSPKKSALRRTASTASSLGRSEVGFAGDERDTPSEAANPLTRAASSLSRGSSSGQFGQKETTINHSRFEKKKRRIAARLRTQQELENFRNETGATLGGQWVDQKWVTRALMEQEDEKDKFHAKQWLKEVGLYVLFVFAFTWVIYSGRSNEAFIGYKQFWTRTVDKHIGNVSTPETVLEQIEALFLEDFVDRDNFTQDSYTTHAGRGYLHGSVLIGQVRLRQLRVQEGECSRTYAKLAELGIAPSKTCYPSWNDGKEDKVYSKENGTILQAWSQYPFYDYTTTAGASEKRAFGKFGTYHGGGFSANFSAPSARSTLAAMRELHWVDVKTRAVILDFVFFNVDLDLFASYRAVFEMVGSGVVETKSNVEIISLLRYPVLGLMDVIRVGMLGFVYMMVVYYIFEDLDHCRRFGLMKYYSFGWAYVDVVNISLFVLSGMFKITNLVLFELAMPSDISDLGMIARVEELGYSFYIEDQINGLNGFLLWIKMFRYVSITRRLLRLSTVLARGLPDIATYAVLFTVLLYAFAVLGYLLFGNDLSGFLTVTDACFALLRAVYGDIDFGELLAVAGDTGFGYILSWLIISNVVLLNMIIAILSDDYRRVQSEEAEKPTLSVYDKLKAEFLEIYNEVKKLQQRRAAQQPEAPPSSGKVLLLWARHRFSRLMGNAPPPRVAAEAGDRDVDSSDEEGSAASEEDQAASRAGSSYSAQEATRQVGGQWKPFPARVAPAPTDS